MWISVLGLSFVMAVHPLRLGVTLLVISRPRAVQNLLAYWVGGLAVGFPALLVPLLVLHGTSLFRSFVKDSATPAAHCTELRKTYRPDIGLALIDPDQP